MTFGNVELNFDEDGIRAEERKKFLDELQQELDSRIARVEKTIPEHSSSLRKGIVMGYQDIKTLLENKLKAAVRMEELK